MDRRSFIKTTGIAILAPTLPVAAVDDGIGVYLVAVQQGEVYDRNVPYGEGEKCWSAEYISDKGHILRRSISEVEYDLLRTIPDDKMPILDQQYKAYIYNKDKPWFVKLKKVI